MNTANTCITAQKAVSVWMCGFQLFSKIRFTLHLASLVAHRRI